MSKPPELWAFILANMGLFISSSLLTGLCYLAYRQDREQPSYRFATVGFGLVVLGGLVEPVYQLGVGVDYTLNGAQLLLLQAGEGIFLALGLGLLFYAITQHESGSRASSTSDTPTWMDGDIDWGSD